MPRKHTPYPDVRSFFDRENKLVRRWYCREDGEFLGTTQLTNLARKGYHFRTGGGRQRDVRPTQAEAVEVLWRYHCLSPAERRQAVKETRPPKRPRKRVTNG